MSVVVAPALWVVEGLSSDVYVFGETVGVGPDDAWFVDPLRTAFRDAGQLWCEVADAQEIVRSPRFAEHGMSVEPLSVTLGTRELERLRAVARSLGLEPSTLDDLRPWLAGQVLEHTHRARLGVEAATSVHEVLVGCAKEAGKPVHTELPDAEATLAFFGAMSGSVELEYLAWTLDRVTDDGVELERQVAAWCRGDRTVVDDQVAALEVRYPGLHARLLAERNRAWVPRIVTMTSDPEPSFVLVGDSHLSGDDGILSLLERAGQSVRRIT